MKILLIGPQGSGKGTQAKLIAAKLGLVHISTGDLLREASGELRAKIDSYIIGGNLFPDELILEILEKRLEKEDCKNGFILDGFPRNLKQKEMLDGVVSFDVIMEIHISDKEAVRRLTGRVSCEKCGAGFNNATLPPKEGGKCDKCSGKLVRREDDHEEAIKKRLVTYHRDTKPLLDHYGSVEINGEQSIEKVSEDIFKLLDNFK